MTENKAIVDVQFAVGQLVHHKQFDYRGVIIDVDANFQLPEEWYEKVAKSNPPKDKPWYHVLVDGSEQATYVAERHLEVDNSDDPIQHPLVERFFSDLDHGQYKKTSRSIN